MMRFLLAVILAGALTPARAAEHTVICQPLGDATACSDGTIVQPFGDGAYVTREPRDKWGQSRHENDGKPQWNNKAK